MILELEVLRGIKKTPLRGIRKSLQVTEKNCNKKTENDFRDKTEVIFRLCLLWIDESEGRAYNHGNLEDHAVNRGWVKKEVVR